MHNYVGQCWPPFPISTVSLTKSPKCSVSQEEARIASRSHPLFSHSPPKYPFSSGIKNSKIAPRGKDKGLLLFCWLLPRGGNSSFLLWDLRKPHRLSRVITRRNLEEFKRVEKGGKTMIALNIGFRFGFSPSPFLCRLSSLWIRSKILQISPKNKDSLINSLNYGNMGILHIIILF
jgi:hypothetical protein